MSIKGATINRKKKGETALKLIRWMYVLPQWIP